MRQVVYIERLTTCGWRNMQAQTLTFGHHVVLLEGDNAQGKTNILEALYLCATARSFRLASGTEMVCHGASGAQVKAELVREDVRHHVEVAVSAHHRQLRVDGKAHRHSRSLLALMNMVAFFPDDLRLIKEGPERRRQFLDRAVANASVDFAGHAIAYLRSLKARNMLLKAPQVDRALLSTYDQQLAVHGAHVHQARAAFVAAWQQPANAQLKQLLGPGEDPMGPLTLSLAPGVPAWAQLPAVGPGEDPQPLIDSFRQALTASWAKDRARAQTSVGPHRGDLVCCVHGRLARLYASQGQQRALVLALKLAQVQALRARWGTAPILLLDDVSSELDPRRTEALFAQVAHSGGQTFVTTCDSAALPTMPQAQRWQVVAGCVTQR